MSLLETLFSQETIERLSWMLVHFLWQATAVALLLIAGIIIPTALVFAAPQPLPQNEADSAAVETSAPPVDDQPARSQVLLAFTVIDVFADRVLDTGTAAQVRDFPTRIQPADANQLGVSIVPPMIEELGVPLRDIFARFELIAARSKDLTDLLISHGYAQTMSKPRILTFADESASITIGQANDPNALDSAPTGEFLRLTVVPHVLEDMDATRLEIDYEDQHAIGSPDDPSRSMSNTQIASTIVVPNDGHAAIVARGTGRSDARLPLLLIGPTIVNRPQRAERQDPNTNARTNVTLESQNDASGQDLTQITIDWVIAKASTGTVLDRETMLLIGNILADERPKIAEQIAGTDPKQKMTLGELLKKYVAEQSLSQETGQALIDLLKTRGLATVQSSPTLVAADKQPFELRSVSEEWFSPPRSESAGASQEPAPTRFEYGTVIDGTAHAEQDNSVTLEMVVTFTEPEAKTQPDGLPVVRKKETWTMVNVADNRYLSLLMELSNHNSSQAQDVGSLLVMVKPKIAGRAPQPEISETRYVRLNHQRPQRVRDLLVPVYQKYVHVEDTDASDPDDSGHILAITAPTAITNTIMEAIRKLDMPRREVLLDVRVVEVDRTALKRLGIEWSLPKTQTSVFNTNWPRGVQIDRSPNPTFTDALTVIVNQLKLSDQARIITNPQLLARNGRQAQLRSVREEWFMISDIHLDPTVFVISAELEKIPSAAILSIVPRIGDGNDITLELAMSVSESFPKGQAVDLPLDRFPQTRNPVTIQNGGTVILAGLPVESGDGDQTPRVIAIFITATRVPDISEIVPSSDGIKSTDSSSQSRTLTTSISAQQVADARRSHTSSDPLVQELAKSIVDLEKERIALHQTLAPSHPTLRQKQDVLETLQHRLAERRAVLEDEYNASVKAFI
jgi:type II secretory pathway component GspD/PulD (secretin)